VIAVDTNILVYALREESPWHEPAARRLRELAEGRGSWAIPAPCLHEFLAIATHPRIFVPPTPLAIAIDFVEAVLESPTLLVLSESDGYWAVLHGLVRASNVSGPRIHDARIAALCLHTRVAELWSADRDFGRFPQLNTRNPLVGGG
jgi:toxin-antitoxin system PIN domain toxin